MSESLYLHVVRDEIKWHITFCSYKKLAVFLPRFFCGEAFLIYHKFFCGARCRQFLVGAVTGWAIGAQSF